MESILTSLIFAPNSCAFSLVCDVNLGGIFINRDDVDYCLSTRQIRWIINHSDVYHILLAGSEPFGKLEGDFTFKRVSNDCIRNGPIALYYLNPRPVRVVTANIRAAGCYSIESAR